MISANPKTHRHLPESRTAPPALWTYSAATGLESAEEHPLAGFQVRQAFHKPLITPEMAERLTAAGFGPDCHYVATTAGIQHSQVRGTGCTDPVLRLADGPGRTAADSVQRYAGCPALC